jgi:hypothetical protein
MSDELTEPEAEQPQDDNLRDRLETIYLALRAKDVTVRKYERQITANIECIELARQRNSVANAAMRQQENFLRVKAARALRDETGLNPSPGMIPRENAQEMRLRLANKFKAAQADANAKLANPPIQPFKTNETDRETKPDGATLQS